MKERDPFTGSLFDAIHQARDFGKSRGATDIVEAADSAEKALVETTENIARGQLEAGPRPNTRSLLFCMAHMKWKEGVAIYIDGKRPLFLCPEEAEKRGAWKWEGKWPSGK